jgi:hypothetical protein
MTNNNLNITSAALAVLEALLLALRLCNAAEGTMAVQSNAYGKIADALRYSIANALKDGGLIATWEETTAIADRLYEEAIDNGEDILYQLTLWNLGSISL